MIELDGRSLTCAQVVAVAGRSDAVTLGDDVERRVAAAADVADDVARLRPVYGRSTGVGANRDVALAEGDDAAGARALLRSHATSAGPLRAPERVRAMLVVRLNQLAAGGSGVAVPVVRALAGRVGADVLPPVRELGSIGTGDLAALATTALTLLDEVSLGPGDALAFLSSNAGTLADAALAVEALSSLLRAAVVVASLTFAATDGAVEAFAPAVEQVTPFPGAQQVCRWMRTLTAGAAPAARIQDPFGLRTLPQVHGAALDALAALRHVVEALVNAPCENPVVTVGTGPGGSLTHHGGFHAASLAQALDAAVLAVAQAGALVLARLSSLMEPSLTGLPAFLGDGTAGASGAMGLEYVAASALASLRALAAPAGLQGVVLSRGVEEDASFASLAAVQALDAAAPLRSLVAAELVAAVRALRLRGSVPTGVAGAVLTGCEEVCPEAAGFADRDLTADLLAAEAALDRLPTLASLE